MPLERNGGIVIERKEEKEVKRALCSKLLSAKLRSD